MDSAVLVAQAFVVGDLPLAALAEHYNLVDFRSFEASDHLELIYEEAKRNSISKMNNHLTTRCLLGFP